MKTSPQQPAHRTDSTDVQFPGKVLCLTLEADRERQLSAVSELAAIGIREFEFIPGIEKDDDLVKHYFRHGKVKRYPPCFRCGQLDCGLDCNNVLLPVQVAVSLSYRKIFQRICGEGIERALIVEDDVVFYPYSQTLADVALSPESLHSHGFFSDEPTLIRLSKPDHRQSNHDSSVPDAYGFTRKSVMSNPCFAVNNAFARLALSQFETIEHTADVVIHDLLGPKANCWTLQPPLACDKSWCKGEVPSRIHPNRHYLDTLSSRGLLEERTSEERKLQQHIKKAIVRDVCMTGSPRCGSGYVSAVFKASGIDVGHEEMGDQGICSWMFAVSDRRYPFHGDKYSASDEFVHFRHYGLYVRHPVAAIPSLIIENQKAPGSYGFRRRHIRDQFEIDLDDFFDPIDRAAAAYVFWYRLAMKREPSFIARVEYIVQDLDEFAGYLFDARKFEKPKPSRSNTGHRKPYLNQVYPPHDLPEDWQEHLSPITLRELESICRVFEYSLSTAPS